MQRKHKSMHYVQIESNFNRDHFFCRGKNFIHIKDIFTISRVLFIINETHYEKCDKFTFETIKFLQSVTK